MNIDIIFCCTVIAGVLSIMGFALGVYSVIIVKAMEKSTHQVSYVPMREDGKLERDLNAELNAGFE